MLGQLVSGSVDFADCELLLNSTGDKPRGVSPTLSSLTSRGPSSERSAVYRASVDFRVEPPEISSEVFTISLKVIFPLRI